MKWEEKGNKKLDEYTRPTLLSRKSKIESKETCYLSKTTYLGNRQKRRDAEES